MTAGISAQRSLRTGITEQGIVIMAPDTGSHRSLHLGQALLLRLQTQVDTGRHRPLHLGQALLLELQTQAVTDPCT